MPLLSTSEALHVSDSFLSSLYGDDIFRRWKELKDDMKFLTEREYVSWLLDVGNSLKSDTETSGLELLDTSKEYEECGDGGDQYLEASNVKSEFDSLVEEDNLGNSLLADGVGAAAAADYNMLDDVEGGECGQGSMLSPNPHSDRNVDAATDDIIIAEYNVHYDDDPDGITEPNAHDELLHTSSPGDPSAADSTLGVHSPPSDPAAAAVAASILQQVTPGTGSTTYQCPHCTYNSTHKFHVQRHITAVHEQNKKYRCSYCHYRTSIKASLREHLIMKHGYNSRFSCHKCGKAFIRSRQLEIHVARNCRSG